MSDEGQQHLFDLQRIDVRIEQTKARIASFDPQLDEVDAPFQAVEAESDSLRKRFQELKLDERRLTTSSEDRKARLDRLQERLNAVRNLREEAAVHAEADLVRRALEADEQEAFGVMDLVQKAEERLSELETELESTKAEIEPARQELLDARAAEEKALEDLRKEREACAAKVDPRYLSLYERIKDGGRSVAVAPMTQDGACGVCFNMIPPQLQNEVRHGETLMRCEACGVILARPVDKTEADLDDANPDPASQAVDSAGAAEEELAEGGSSEPQAAEQTAETE